MHRDPRNFFPYPEDFWPERWIIAEDPLSFEAETAQIGPFIHNVNAFIPFSLGPANCVGKNLAQKELRMVTCHLMQQMTFQFAEGYDPDQFDRDVDDFYALQVGNIPAVVTPRTKT